MAKVKTAMMKAALSGLYHSRAHRLLAPYTQGAGVIFTLHSVRPEPAEPKPFGPNRILEVTPDFLDAVLDQVQAAGLDVVSLDEAVRRLRAKEVGNASPASPWTTATATISNTPTRYSSGDRCR